jgi:hypothetical protein
MMKTRTEIEKVLVRWGAGVGMMVVAICAAAILVPVPAVLADEHDEEEEWEDEREEQEYSTVDVLDFLKAKWPEAVKRLEEIKREEPMEEYAEALETAYGVMVEYYELEEMGTGVANSFLSIMKLELERDGLWEEIWEGDGDEEKVLKELRKLSGQIFDLEMGLEKEELGRLKAEVREFELELAQRQKERDEVIEAEIEERLAEIEADREEEEEDGDDDEGDDDDD